MIESPFKTHRSKVLGHYGTAKWLRQLVLSMWNGNAYPVSLSPLTNLDAEHMAAVAAMIAAYHKHGENDAEFMALAEDCRTRLAEEQAAAVRADELEAWLRQVRTELRQLGLESEQAEDRYSWFESLFDQGLQPADAAQRAKTEPAQY